MAVPLGGWSQRRCDGRCRGQSDAELRARLRGQLPEAGKGKQMGSRGASRRNADVSTHFGLLTPRIIR